jgi:hypothetical protein
LTHNHPKKLSGALKKVVALLLPALVLLSCNIVSSPTASSTQTPATPVILADSAQPTPIEAGQPTEQPTSESTATPSSSSTLTLEPTPTLRLSETEQPPQQTERPPPVDNEQSVPAIPASAEIGELPHYNLSLNLDYYGHQAQVEETVTVSNDSPDSWSEVVFNVSTAFWPGIFTLEALEVIQDGVPQEVTPRLEGTMLHVDLAHPAEPGQTLVVNMTYHLALPALDPVGWGPTGNAGWGPDVTQMGDWYPALVPYNSDAGGWQTWRYHPVGDPVKSVVSDFDVTIEIPETVTVAAAGLIEEDGGVGRNLTLLRRYRLEQARAFSFLASPNFDRLDGQAGQVPIHIYTTSADQLTQQVVLDTVIQAMELFTELFGPYAYSEFVMAENGFLTAMEYPAMVSLSGFAFDAYDGTPQTLLVAITAHEVCHQWYYAVVGNDQVNEPWLDEAMSMMCELLFYERYYPDFVEWWWQFRVDRWQPEGYVDVSIYDFDHSESFVHNMYGQAAHFMDTLRLWMGPDAFLAFVKDYYQRHVYQFATAESFFAVAREHTDADLASLARAFFQKVPASLTEEDSNN